MFKLRTSLAISVATIGFISGLTAIQPVKADGMNNKCVYIRKDGFHYSPNRNQADGNGKVYRIPLQQAQQRGFTKLGVKPQRHINRFIR
ncbi:hypothetical protein [Nicoliella lavandulae]|uniref:Uncharacterized protein n=1 Tax=Nicoliella lavandulae TaxID=3082954 RepID=A0ABU8SJK9_9LACO